MLISWLRLGVSFAAIGIALFVSWMNGTCSRLPRVPGGHVCGALPVAGFIHIFVGRVNYGWWIGFATSVLDVTIVSVTLTSFLFVGRPDLAVMNPVAFPVYFLALAATSMRLDHRACAVAGWTRCSPVRSNRRDRAAAGGLTQLEMGTQGVRIILLGTMGMLGTLVNLRMQKPHVLSANDGLTGLLNRRAFEDRWNGEVARVRRHGRPISIAAIDIDYFKQFNDTNGHAAGDMALRSVAG